MVDSVEKVVIYALGAGGRRFESFCPDLKIKELQGFVTPFFWPFQKSGHKKDTLFRNISYRFPILFSNSPAKKDRLFTISIDETMPWRHLHRESLAQRDKGVCITELLQHGRRAKTQTERILPFLQ